MKKLLILLACLAPLSAFAQLALTPGVGATSISTTSAVMSGSITGTNGLTNAVNIFIFHDEVDDGTNSTSLWPHAIALGTFTNGSSFSNLFFNLIPSRPHFYRVYGVESNTFAWSNPTNFFTLAGAPTNSPNASSNRTVMVDSTGKLLVPALATFLAANDINSGSSSVAFAQQSGLASQSLYSATGAYATNSGSSAFSVTGNFSTNAGTAVALQSGASLTNPVLIGATAAGNFAPTNNLITAGSAQAQGTNATLNRFLNLDASLFTNLPSALVESNLTGSGGIPILAGTITGTNLLKSVRSSDTTRATITADSQSVIINPSSNIPLNGGTASFSAGTISSASPGFTLQNTSTGLGAQWYVDGAGLHLTNTAVNMVLDISGAFTNVTIGGSPVITAATLPMYYFPFQGNGVDCTAALNAFIAAHHPGEIYLSGSNLVASATGATGGAVGNLAVVLSNSWTTLHFTPHAALYCTGAIVSGTTTAAALLTITGNASHMRLTGPGEIAGYTNRAAPYTYGVNNDCQSNSDIVVDGGLQIHDFFVPLSFEPQAQGNSWFTHGVVDGVTVANSGGSDISDGPALLFGGDDIVVRNTTVKNALFKAIEYASNALCGTNHGLTVTTSLFQDILGGAFYTAEIGAGSQDVWDVTFANNRFVNTAAQTNVVSGAIVLTSLATPRVHGLALIGNSVQNLASNTTGTEFGLAGGFQLDQGTFFSGRIIGNIVQGCWSSGLRLFGTNAVSSPVIEGNSFDSNNIAGFNAGIDLLYCSGICLLNNSAHGNGTDLWFEATSANVEALPAANYGVIIGGSAAGLLIGGDVNPNAANTIVTIGGLRLTSIYVTSSNALPTSAAFFSNVFYDCNTTLIGVGSFTNTLPSINSVLKGQVFGYRNSGANTLVLNANSSKTFDGVNQFITLNPHDYWVGQCVTNVGACYTTWGSTVLPQLSIGNWRVGSVTNAPANTVTPAYYEDTISTNGQHGTLPVYQ